MRHGPCAARAGGVEDGVLCARAGVRPRDVGFQDGGGARLVLLSRSFVPQ